MKRNTIHATFHPAFVLVLVLLTSSMFTSCTGDSSTAGPLPSVSPVLAITGNFDVNVLEVGISEVTVLFDGKQIAHEACQDLCDVSHVAVTTNADPGSHTITFRVDSLSCSLEPCTTRFPIAFWGEVSVSKSGAVVQIISLDQRTARSGSNISYEINVTP